MVCSGRIQEGGLGNDSETSSNNNPCMSSKTAATEC